MPVGLTPACANALRAPHVQELLVEYIEVRAMCESSYPG